jgi:hypothetical protein
LMLRCASAFRFKAVERPKKVVAVHLAGTQSLLSCCDAYIIRLASLLLG